MMTATGISGPTKHKAIIDGTDNEKIATYLFSSPEDHSFLIVIIRILPVPD